MKTYVKTFALFALTLSFVIPQAASAQDDVTIRVESSDNDREVILARVTGRAVSGSASAITSEDLCMAPCSASLESGFHTLLIHGDHTREADTRTTLQPGNYKLKVDPGNSAAYTAGQYLIGGGLGLLLSSLLLVAADDSFNTPFNRGTMIAGGLMTVLGIPLMQLNRTSIHLQYQGNRAASSTDDGNYALNFQTTW